MTCVLIFYSLDKTTSLLLQPHFHGPTVVVVTGFYCGSSLENEVSSSPIGVNLHVASFRSFSGSSLLTTCIQLQFHQVLLAASLLLQALQAVLEHPGSYHQQTPDMESSQDLNCSTKRLTRQGHQPW